MRWPQSVELAPIYEECNLANDHNLMIMDLMQKVPETWVSCFVTRKAFLWDQCSGKHNNWSLSTNTGVVPMPGKKS
jgi:glutamine synthetase